MGETPDLIVGENAVPKRLPRVFSDTETIPKPILEPEDRRHGSWNGYTNFGCRCGPCKAACTAYKAARKPAKRAENVGAA